MAEEQFHIPTAFKTGNRVKVAREVPQALAWHEEWGTNAAALLGLDVIVKEVDAIRGFFCERKGMVRAWLPSPALEPYAKNNCVIEVPGV